MSYIGDLPEDFNPLESLKSKYNPNDEWNFEERETWISEPGLSYKSGFTLNLRKKYPK